MTASRKPNKALSVPEVEVTVMDIAVMALALHHSTASPDTFTVGGVSRPDLFLHAKAVGEVLAECGESDGSRPYVVVVRD